MRACKNALYIWFQLEYSKHSLLAAQNPITIGQRSQRQINWKILSNKSIHLILSRRWLLGHKNENTNGKKRGEQSYNWHDLQYKQISQNYTKRTRRPLRNKQNHRNILKSFLKNNRSLKGQNIKEHVQSQNVECYVTAHIRHQCRKTAVISCHSCLFNSGVEKMNCI